MKTEIEVKFLDVDIADARERLEAAAAHLEQPSRTMRRQVFYPTDHNPDSFLRVRDEGDKVTLTYKVFEGAGLHGAKEVEVVVSDFTDTIDILTRTGLERKSYQETRRETWVIGTTEIVIDEWPWLHPFIEIEGESEQDVRDVAAKLGFEWDSATFGSATQAYRAEYPQMRPDAVADNIPVIKFDEPVPDLLLGK